MTGCLDVCNTPDTLFKIPERSSIKSVRACIIHGAGQAEEKTSFGSIFLTPLDGKGRNLYCCLNNKTLTSSLKGREKDRDFENFIVRFIWCGVGFC